MAVEMLLGLADQAYQRRDWASALPLYQNAAAIDPGRAAALGLALAIGHCRIELGDPDGSASDATAPTGSEREQIMVSRIRFRARGLCQAGAPERAVRLLRLLAPYDPPIADTYRVSVDAQPGAPRAASPGGEPRCLADSGLTDAHVAAMRQRAAGRRLLMVYRRAYFGVPGRTYQHFSLSLDSARRFGFEARHLNTSLTEGPERAGFPAALQATIADFDPDIIVYDEAFGADPVSRDPTIGAAVLDVLAAARRERGTAVVNVFYDAWEQPRENLFAGLGHGVDLVAHMNPFLLGCGTPAQNAATFCWMTPIGLPEPAVPRATIARAGFAGSVYGASIPRLVWWAEAAHQGLRLDFLETDHAAANQRSDQEFADLLHAYQLSVNLTRRNLGMTIITGRTIEVPLCGGVLLEEASVDSAYFLTPGVHYEEFTTVAELRELIDTLLDDPGRRARLADAGQHWVRRYFTGDYYWTGVTRILRS